MPISRSSPYIWERRSSDPAWGRAPALSSSLLDFCCVELFKHKERLASASKLPEPELLEAVYALVSRVEFVNEAHLSVGTWVEAYRLCKGIDEKDTPYVALALHLEGRLWTEDDELKTGLRARAFDRFFDP